MSLFPAPRTRPTRLPGEPPPPAEPPTLSAEELAQLETSAVHSALLAIRGIMRGTRHIEGCMAAGDPRFEDLYPVGCSIACRDAQKALEQGERFLRERLRARPSALPPRSTHEGSRWRT